ncbi:hypothetical protein [Deinococcus sp. Marseille-Q6407]|uniref:hypothetical protein n=1 Tax=Deinococcus sp. Marseille-Q6407 TaxID=2969223 RepID=UPI0021BE5A04|nr:hypothetical protein [Deinococcus sp. Marseille-Q6407]
MPRPKKPYAEKAKHAFLRGTAHSSPHAAMMAGCRTEEEWEARQEGFRNRYYIENGRKARRAVKKRHPVAEVRNVSN